MADGSITLKVGLDTASLKTALSNVGKGVTGALTGVAKVSTAVTAAWGALSAFSVQVGATFEVAMAKTATIMDKSVVSTEQMQKDIQNLSTEMGISATEIADATYNVISATGDTENAVSMVADASKLAMAGFTDTGSAVSVLTTAMNAYGMAATETEKISDSLIMTQNLGVTTVAELSAYMGKAIATASAYGVDLGNIEAAYVALTKSGINTAESTTYMSAMFKELGDTGSDVGAAIQEMTGTSFADLMEQGMSVADVLQVLYTHCGKDSTALMNLWGSAEAGKASNAILNQGFDTFNENLQTIEDSVGTTESAYETMCGTMQHQTDLLKTNLQGLGIGIYEGLSEGLGSAAGKANEMVGALREALVKGGIDGLTNEIANQLPVLTEAPVNIATKALGAVSKWLPNVSKHIPSKLCLHMITIVHNDCLRQLFG